MLTQKEPKCCDCNQSFDCESLEFWLTKSNDDIPWDSRNCTPCYYEFQFGTRNPTAQQFIELGWPIPESLK